MHSNNFVVAIRHNEQFIKESVGGVVALAFGSEYQIRLRNKHNRQAVAKVWIDEENVSEGGIIVSANGFVDLDCNILTRKRFKFVSSDSGEAIDVGKNNKDDDSNGVIRVEWRLEKERKEPVYVPYPDFWKCGQNVSNALGAAPESCGFTKQPLSEGCTVEGGASDQRFTARWVDLEYETTVITLTLRGFHRKSPAKNKAKFCESCGEKILQKTAKFCSGCGLTIR